MTEGIISVLYKKNKKRRDDPRNYRPITLLNGDYKILTRILTQRMNKAVVQFVSDEIKTVLYRPNAFIAENLLRLQMIQAYMDKKDHAGLFIFLDMEKAFDRCSWEFMLEGLTAVGFNDRFVNYPDTFASHTLSSTPREERGGGRRMY